MSEYRCGSCDSRSLVVRAVWLVCEGAWEVTCGDGHVVVPVPGEEYVALAAAERY